MVDSIIIPAKSVDELMKLAVEGAPEEPLAHRVRKKPFWDGKNAHQTRKCQRKEFLAEIRQARWESEQGRAELERKFYEFMEPIVGTFDWAEWARA